MKLTLFYSNMSRNVFTTENKCLKIVSNPNISYPGHGILTTEPRATTFFKCLFSIVHTFLLILELEEQ